MFEASVTVMPRDAMWRAASSMRCTSLGPDAASTAMRAWGGRARGFVSIRGANGSATRGPFGSYLARWIDFGIDVIRHSTFDVRHWGAVAPEGRMSSVES